MSPEPSVAKPDTIKRAHFAAKSRKAWNAKATQNGFEDTRQSPVGLNRGRDFPALFIFYSHSEILLKNFNLAAIAGTHACCRLLELTEAFVGNCIPIPLPCSPKATFVGFDVLDRGGSSYELAAIEPYPLGNKSGLAPARPIFIFGEFAFAVHRIDAACAIGETVFVFSSWKFQSKCWER